MSFELQVLLKSVAIPTVASLIGCWILLSANEGSDWEDDSPVQGIWLKTLLGCLFCGWALVASDLAKRDLLLQPAKWLEWNASYRFQWLVFAVPASMILLGIVRIFFSAPRVFSSIAWPIILTLSVAALGWSLLEVDAWGDKLQAVLMACLVGVVSIAWNTYSYDNMVTTGASRWSPWVLVAQFGCITAIALQSYGSLGQWSLSCISITFGAAVCCLARGSQSKAFCSWNLSVVIAPLIISATTTFLLTLFFRSKALPLWLSACILFLPTIVWLVDIVFSRYGNAWTRAIVAAIVSGIALGAVIVVTKPFESEW